MKLLITTLFSLFFLSSCAFLSSPDDQIVSLSSDTDQGTLIVEIYNREKDASDIVTITIDKPVHKDVSINPQQVVTILLDVVEGKKTNAILLFSLPSGKTIEKNIDAKVNDKVFIIIENNAVIELNDEDWYKKLNKDRELSPTEMVLAVVFSPIIVPIALVTLMVATLFGG